MTHRNIWVNAVTFGMHMQVSDRDVYLHTLPMFHCNGWGLPYTMAGLGATQVVIRKIDGAEILRRVEQHGVTMMAGAPAVWNAVLEAAADWDGEIPGRDRVRIIVAGAPPPSKTIARVEAELGWEFNQIYGLTETAPLLTINRPRAEYDDLEPEERAKRLSRAGVPSLGTRLQTSESGEVLAQSNTVLAGYWENPDASAEALDGGWFHTGDGGYDRRRRLPHDLRPQEGRDHHRRRERVLDRGGGRRLQPPGRRGGRRHRHPRRQVGRDGHRARRRRRGRAGHRGGDHRPLPRQDRRATRSRSGSSSATSWPAPPPARSRSSSSASPSGPARSARSTDRPAARPVHPEG